MGKKSKLQIKAEVILTDSKGFSVGKRYGVHRCTHVAPNPSHCGPRPHCAGLLRRGRRLLPVLRGAEEAEDGCDTDGADQGCRSPHSRGSQDGPGCG